MAEFGDRSVRCGNKSLVELKAQLGKNLPDGITAEVEVYYEVANIDFGTWQCRTPEGAVAVKAKLDEGSAILKMLPRAVDKDGRFEAGGGFIQHPNEAVEVFISAVRAFIAKHYTTHEGDVPKDDILSAFDENPRRIALLSRFNDDDSVVGALYERLCCIDEAGREWGHCAFALNIHPQWDKKIEIPWKDVA